MEAVGVIWGAVVGVVGVVGVVEGVEGVGVVGVVGVEGWQLMKGNLSLRNFVRRTAHPFTVLFEIHPLPLILKI